MGKCQVTLRSRLEVEIKRAASPYTCERVSTENVAEATALLTGDLRPTNPFSEAFSAEVVPEPEQPTIAGEDEQERSYNLLNELVIDRGPSPYVILSPLFFHLVPIVGYKKIIAPVKPCESNARVIV